MPPEIVKLSRSILNNNPVKIEIIPVKSTAELISQYIYFVEKGDKNALLTQVLNREDEKNALVFTRTKHGADKVVKILSKNNITAEAIHSNKGQSARQRALSNFKSGSTRVLVATDIASRGIDVDELDFVINYEIPNIAETYVHRIGRTGRAGAKGIALSFCDSEERSYLRDIEKLISKKIDVVKDHPFVSDQKVTSEQKSEAKKETTGRSKYRPSQKERKRQKQWSPRS